MNFLGQVSQVGLTVWADRLGKSGPAQIEEAGVAEVSAAAAAPTAAIEPNSEANETKAGRSSPGTQGRSAAGRGPSESGCLVTDRARAQRARSSGFEEHEARSC